MEPELLEKRSCIFYKLIIASMLQDDKFRIPDKFTKKHGHELSNIATLTSPSGRVWLIELERVEKKLWFHKGWHEFVEYYSIRIGYLILFRYEGMSNFNVRIFNLAASEISYPCNAPPSSSNESTRSDQCVVGHDKEHKGDDQEKATCSCINCPVHFSSKSNFLDKNANHQPKQTNHQSNYMTELNNYAFKNKYLRGESPGTVLAKRSIDIHFGESGLTFALDETGQRLVIDAEQRTKKAKQSGKPGKIKVKEALQGTELCSAILSRRGKSVTQEQKERTLRAASMFKPENPSCIVVLRASYVYKGLHLHLPRYFARAYLKDVTGFINLLCEGKQYNVRCVALEGDVKLGRGWPEFVWQKNLDEGDVCVFEVIKAENTALRVTLFRVLEVAQTMNNLPNDEPSLNLLTMTPGL